MTIALAAFAFAANAQFVIGGNVAVGHDNIHIDNYVDGTTTTDISIMPKIGYWLNDKMQVGAQLGWSMSYEREYMGSESDYTSGTYSGITFAPYFRYNVANWKNFTVFCEAQGNLTIGFDAEVYYHVGNVETTTTNPNGYTQLGLAVVPGLNYALSEHFSLDLYINLAGLYLTNISYEGGATHQWGLGVNMDSQSLFNHFNNFAIGFNYAF